MTEDTETLEKATRRINNRSFSMRTKSKTAGIIAAPAGALFSIIPFTNIPEATSKYNNDPVVRAYNETNGSRQKLQREYEQALRNAKQPDTAITTGLETLMERQEELLKNYQVRRHIEITNKKREEQLRLGLTGMGIILGSILLGAGIYGVGAEMAERRRMKDWGVYHGRV